MIVKVTPDRWTARLLPARRRKPMTAIRSPFLHDVALATPASSRSRGFGEDRILHLHRLEDDERVTVLPPRAPSLVTTCHTFATISARTSATRVFPSSCPALMPG